MWVNISSRNKSENANAWYSCVVVIQFLIMNTQLLTKADNVLSALEHPNLSVRNSSSHKDIYYDVKSH